MPAPVAVSEDDPVAVATAECESLRRRRPLLVVPGGRHGTAELIAASATAALVVVGPRRYPDRLVVAGSARCPVLVVPGTGVLAVHAWRDTGLEPDRADAQLRRAVVRAPLGATLLATALSAQLLVLGLYELHRGLVLRFLLHRQPCPVELVPVRVAAGSPRTTPPLRVLEDHR